MQPKLTAIDPNYLTRRPEHDVKLLNERIMA
jgi:hypothetical protein